MSYAQRKDLGVRVAGEKAHKPDEFLTRSQIIPGTNITFDYLSNWDIRINALTGGGGGDKPRYIVADIVLMNKFNADLNHYDIQDPEGVGDKVKYFGTHVFADIHHFWGLNHPDGFIYSLIDCREATETAPYRVDSIPTVVGVDGDTVRIVATDTASGNDDPVRGGTRFDPRIWVTLNEDEEMTNTRFVFDEDQNAEHAREKLPIELTPRYIIRIEEIIHPSFNTYNGADRDLITGDIGV